MNKLKATASLLLAIALILAPIIPEYFLEHHYNFPRAASVAFNTVWSFLIGWNGGKLHKFIWRKKDGNKTT